MDTERFLDAARQFARSTGMRFDTVTFSKRGTANRLSLGLKHDERTADAAAVEEYVMKLIPDVGITKKELAKKAGYSYDHCGRILSRLKGLGRVRRDKGLWKKSTT